MVSHEDSFQRRDKWQLGKRPIENEDQVKITRVMNEFRVFRQYYILNYSLLLDLIDLNYGTKYQFQYQQRYAKWFYPSQLYYFSIIYSNDQTSDELTSL